MEVALNRNFAVQCVIKGSERIGVGLVRGDHNMDDCVTEIDASDKNGDPFDERLLIDGEDLVTAALPNKDQIVEGATDRIT